MEPASPNTMELIFLDNQQPNENSDRLINRPWVFGLPKDIVVNHILPHVILDLITHKHAISADLISVPLNYIKCLQDFRVLLLHEGWKIAEKIIDSEWRFDEASIQEILEQPIATLQNWLCKHTALKDDFVQKEINHILEFVCMANTITDGQLFQICNDVLTELRVLWPDIKEPIKKQFIDTWIRSYKQDFKVGENNLVESMLKQLLSRTSEGLTTQLNDLHGLSGKVPVVYLFSFKDMKRKVRFSSNSYGIQPLDFGLSEDALKQVNLIFSNASTLIKQVFAPLGTCMGEQLKMFENNLVKVMKVLKEINVNGDTATQHDLPSLFQDPAIQMLFFADSNNTFLMQWLSSYDINYINQEEPITHVSPLEVALQAGNIASALCIAEYGISLKDYINKGVDTFKNTPLHNACHEGNSKFIEFLLVHGANPNALNYSNKTPLLVNLSKEADETHVEVSYHIAQSLIKNGAAINQGDHLDVTPLMQACVNTCSVPSYIKIVRLLLQEGALVDATDCNGVTSLFYACRFKELALVKLLIANGANVNYVHKQNKHMNMTPLHRACFYNNLEIVEELLKNYAHVHAKTADEMTAYDLIEKGRVSEDATYEERIALQNSADRIKHLLRFYAQPQRTLSVENKPKDSCIIS